MQELESGDASGYPAFRLRLRALLLDGAICAGVFFVGAIAAAVLFEEIPAARMGGVALVVAIVLAYEPIMVARYGGTIGHRALNIRVVESRSQHNLPLWKAAARSLVKHFFGVLSLVFMFVTRRAQGLHDLAAGAEVKIRDPRHARAEDYFTPEQTSEAQALASPLRRIAIIGLYGFLFLIIIGIVAALSLSGACIEMDVCSSDESLFMSLLNIALLIGWGVLIVLGWKGRLLGCRRRGSLGQAKPTV